MTPFVLRDWQTPTEVDQFIGQYVVVMGDLEFGRSPDRAIAEQQARFVLCDEIRQGSVPHVDVVYDHPGHADHGATVCWYAAAYGEGEPPG